MRRLKTPDGEMVIATDQGAAVLIRRGYTDPAAKSEPKPPESHEPKPTPARRRKTPSSRRA